MGPRKGAGWLLATLARMGSFAAWGTHEDGEKNSVWMEGGLEWGFGATHKEWAGG